MDKMIVAVFDNETAAYQGVKALKELDDEGSITLFGVAVVAKDAQGAVSVKHEGDQGPVGTAVGLTTGSLIGLLGGPVGLAVGAVTGTIAGSLYDLAQLGIGGDFMDEVSLYLVPGKTAVVAEVDEEWVTPLDARMRDLKGIVIRRTRDAFIEAQFQREIAADQAELDRLEAEHRQAVGEAKARLQARIDATKQRMQNRHEQMKQRLAAVKREGEAKIKALQESAAKAHGERKVKMEKRLAQARANHKARTEKLSQAAELIREAASI
jgi:uncharacterized membrane protein